MLRKLNYQAADRAFRGLTEVIPTLRQKLLPDTLQGGAENARERFDEATERWQASEAGQDEGERLGHFEDAAFEVDEALKSLTKALASLTKLQECAPEGAFEALPK